MADLFILSPAGIRRLACPASEPLRLDAHAEPVAGGAGAWAASLVSFAASDRAPRRWVLVVTPDAGLAVGVRPVTEGVREILHGDHLLFAGRTEAIFSTDAVPAPVPSGGPTGPCPVCSEALGGDERETLLSCPRCGARACNLCWSAFPRSVCPTMSCGQPAALDRALWVPSRHDFVLSEDS